ncbi:MAG: acetolactate synthase small subunit [Arenicella sp.]
MDLNAPEIDHDAQHSYTLTVFTENVPGLLSEVVSVFTRIKMNIDTLTVSASRIEGIHRFTVTIDCTKKLIDKITAQLEKKVDIVAAFAYLSHEVVAREIAMFKVDIKVLQDDAIREGLLDLHNPAVIEEHDKYAVLIKSGKEAKIQAMFDYLEPHNCIYEFVRSGRIAVVREMDPFSKRLDSMDKDFH